MANTNTAAGTALGPMVVAATEQFLPAGQRIVDDPLALSLLSGPARFFTAACRWAPLRSLLFKLSEGKGPGVWGGVLGRKRFIDDITREAVNHGIKALVDLGAGFDTRGLRFAVPFGVPAFEVDLPGNVADKRAALDKALGGVPEGLHLIPVDFETADLGAALSAAGYDAEAPTLFVWEGVTQYLTEPAVRKTLDFLATAPQGSKLAFTYVLGDFIAGDDMHGAAPIYRHLVQRYGLWHFGLQPEQIDAFLAPYGWRLIEDVGATSHRRRYLEPAGRDLPLMEIERVAVAEKAG